MTERKNINNKKKEKDYNKHLKRMSARTLANESFIDMKRTKSQSKLQVRVRDWFACFWCPCISGNPSIEDYGVVGGGGRV